jgi:hypothetical protein
MTDISCSICSNNTKKLSKISKFTENSKFTWEHDSTLKILGWREVEVQLRICQNCFHFIIFPKFDASILYGDKPSKLRKEAYELHFPEKIYGQKRSEICFREDFSRLSRDFFRFYQTSRFVSNHTHSILLKQKEIRILDWGGGDGYISATYASILSILTGQHVVNYIFDYTDWGDLKTKKVGINDLKNMEPFNIIIFSHILEHSHSPVLDLKLASSFLSEKGIIICEVPDERLYTIVKLFKKRRFGLNYHVHSFTRRSLHKLLENAGFKSVGTQYQYTSSYRGERISAIVGVAQKEEFDFAENLPGIMYEIISLLSIIIRELGLRFYIYLKN